MNNLVQIQHKNEIVITTEQLANIYGCDAKIINNNFGRNQDKFSECIHYFKLEGNDLKEFKGIHQNDESLKFVSVLYLWTRRGASRHCKMIGTDQAWEMFDELEETYFAHKPMSQLEILAASAQQLLEQQRRMDALEQQQQKQSAQIDNIQEIAVYRPDNEWREKTNRLIIKMAGENKENIREIRSESYGLLEKRLGVLLGTRLSNKRRRALDEGISRSKANEINNLDVIADDKKLIEGYVSIIKEMAIRYDVNV